MIVMSPIANYVRDGRPIRAAHLLSDMTGNAGTGELMKFGMSIGLKVAWLQNDDSETEHFDLMGVKIEEAVKAGAVKVDRYRLVAIIREKRAYQARRRSHEKDAA